MKGLVAVAAASALLALPPAAPADWPVYGHDLSNSRSAGADGPTIADARSLKQAWRFDSSNGDFTATPVVADGALVAGTNLGTVYALDAVSGKQRWSHDVGDQVNGSAAIDSSAPGGPTAYVPVARKGSPHLVALSLADGSVRWDTVLSRETDSYVYGSPTFWNGSIYIGTSGPNNDESTARGSVVALDEATGAIRWQTFTVPAGHDGGAVWSTPAIDTQAGRLYVGTGNAYHDPAAATTDAMLALDAASGAIVGQFQATPDDVWELNSPFQGPDHDFGASPNLMTGADGRALIGEGSKSGVYWALDRATMKPVWNTSVGPGSQVGGILASTAYDGTHVYGNDSINAAVWALTRAGGSAWSSSDGGSLEFSPVAVANGVLYSGSSSGALTARDASTGEVLGKQSLPGPTFGGISVVGKAVYVAIGTGPVIAPLPETDTSKLDGAGSIVAFGDTSASGATQAASHGRGKRHRAQQLVLAPRRVEPGRRVVFRFRTLRDGHPVGGVAVRLAGHRTRTDRTGRAAMRLRLARAKTYRAVAGGRGFGRASAVVDARTDRARSRPQPPQAKPQQTKYPETFDGSCEFSGSVKFTPPMTSSPQPVAQHALAPGKCTGKFTNKLGDEQLDGVDVTYRAESAGDQVSCAFGVAKGSGALVFPKGEIEFDMTEYRGGATPTIRLTGKHGGEAWMLVTPSQSSDPVAAVQACNGAGLDEFVLDAHMQTMEPISG